MEQQQQDLASVLEKQIQMMKVTTYFVYVFYLIDIFRINHN